jgi:hypothetical protein
MTFGATGAIGALNANAGAPGFVTPSAPLHLGPIDL